MRLQTPSKRAVAFGGYVVALGLHLVRVGLPTDIITLLGWLWLATICWNIDQPVRYHLGFLRDWLPLAAALVLYDISRGRADDGTAPHVLPMLAVDRWLFGGHVPTFWLQERFYDPATVRWWDAAMSTVYFSHFIATPAIAVVLWLRDRAGWLQFIRRWLGLIAAGLATYFLFPAAPPWWAAREGLMPFVDRMSSRGWEAFGLHGAGNVLARAQDLANPVAAMPSLHAGFAMLVTGFLMTRVRPRWRLLLAAYPVAMGLTLVYSGEHWVIDVLVGWAYAGAVLLAVRSAERAWSAQPAGVPDEPAGELVSVGDGSNAGQDRYRAR
ncbi:MAG TPA: phosphatase PAP2 family protein [Micromonosporaceae bacterium]|nr:phosphatase PAP2 family protein [Micromonosporaceae bacterium]